MEIAQAVCFVLAVLLSCSCASAIPAPWSRWWASSIFNPSLSPDTNSLLKKCSHLPPDFKWGFATAAYQIEGAAAEGGRTPSIWDTFSHIPGNVANNDNGDVAVDHYHRFREDVQTMAALGVQQYRLSLSWNRLLPGGVSGSAVNPTGQKFYSQLFDALLAVNITPVVTLFHWDLPQVLDDPNDLQSGWMSEDIVQHYVYYVESAFRLFGDRVKHWITFNEPDVFCLYGYTQGNHAPGKTNLNQYQCGHNVIRCHAAATKVYRSLQQGGKIGITLSPSWAEPFTYLPWDVAAAQRAQEFDLGWFADPVIWGRYPDSMVQRLGDRLPKIEPQLAEDLRISTDFLGMNHYTTRYVSAACHATDNDAGVTFHINNFWGRPIGPRGESTWLYVVPWGFGKLLSWAQNRYGPQLLLWVTENGVSVPNESKLSLEDALQDTFRVHYYHSYIASMCDAVKEGNLNVRAYFAWSLMDNFEWADGYSVRFGSIYVDYNRNQTRYLKQSATWLANFFGGLMPQGPHQEEDTKEEMELPDLTAVTT